MLSDVHYATQVQTDVSQVLISLDKQAKCHLRATGSQLVCVVILLASTIGLMSLPPLSLMGYTTVSLHDVFANPFDQLLVSLIVMSFCISWIFWFRDLKYQSLSAKYETLCKHHSEMIKTSAPLTELSAHYQHLMSMATHFTVTSNVVFLAFLTAIIIYHLHP